MYEYVTALVKQAEYESDTDGSTYASVPFVVLIEAQGATYRECRMLVKIAAHKAVVHALLHDVELPTIDGIEPPRVETR